MARLDSPCAYLLNANCNLGIVLGGGFAKSSTEAVLRSFLLSKARVRFFAHFFNLRQLFAGASSRISFVVLVARTADTSGSILGGYDLTDAEALPIGSQPGMLHELSIDDVVNGGISTPRNQENMEERSDNSVRIMNSTAELARLGIIVSEGVHRTGNKEFIEDLEQVLSGFDDARDALALGLLAETQFLCLYGGRSIDCFDPVPREKSGKWTPQVDLVISQRCPRLISQSTAMRFFRLVWRNTCGHIATNERSARACLLPPRVAVAGSLMIEVAPQNRPNTHALITCACINTFPFDEQVRRYVQTNFNKSILEKTTLPRLHDQKPFLAHSSLRLNSSHVAFEPLWDEQLGGRWSENTKRHTWPVIGLAEKRWQLRAAIDAVVADAYGLTRDQYVHVLATFKHMSYPKAPEICLAMFNELQTTGLDAFTMKHDPYWDIPLNENLPQPVVDLPGFGPAEDEGFRLETAPRVTAQARAPKGLIDASISDLS